MMGHLAAVPSSRGRGNLDGKGRGGALSLTGNPTKSGANLTQKATTREPDDR